MNTSIAKAKEVYNQPTFLESASSKSGALNINLSNVDIVPRVDVRANPSVLSPTGNPISPQNAVESNRSSL